MSRVRAILALLVLLLAAPAQAKKCPPDAVQVGPVCVDRYEASAWQVPDPAKASRSLVRKIQSGKVTLSDLVGGGAVQLGCTGAPFGLADFPASFPSNGNWTAVAPGSPGVYAVSIPGVLPTSCITWFQAEQACALSGKRLLSNQEWQRAAAGTPDPGLADDGVSTCVTNSVAPAQTGTRASCRSAWGVDDMVGNVNEWVADWGDRSQNCGNWAANLGGDFACFGESGVSPFPTAITRGGAWANGTEAGVFAAAATGLPSGIGSNTGFRCGR